MKENNVNLESVSKKGEDYVVRGERNGRRTEVAIHAQYIEGKSRSDAERQFKRAVGMVLDANAQR